MRKIIMLCACMALLTAPVACKKQQGSESDDNAPQETTSSLPSTTNAPSDTTSSGGSIENPAGSSGMGTPDMNGQPATPAVPGSTTQPPEINGSGTNPNPDSNGNPGNPNPAPSNPGANPGQ